SGDAFARLGVHAAYGRLLDRQDDTRAAVPVAALSHAFWLRRFAGDRAILGRTCTLDGRLFQIVGVADRGFSGVEPGRPTDVWLPYSSYNPRAFGNGSFNWFRILGRVKDGVGPEAVASVLQTAFTSFRRDREAMFPAADRTRLVAAPLYVRPAANGVSPLRRQFARSLWVLTAIAALVLMIAGSNVANLSLARAAGREREMALRLSIGAGRGRLVQQVLVESALVAVAACALGLLFAAFAAPSIVGALAPADDPVQLDLRLDWRVVAFAAMITAISTALCGLVPAVRASRVTPMAALKTGDGRAGTHARLMRPFVALQVAFALVVLLVGALLIHSFARLSNVNPGFVASNVVLLNVEPTQRIDGRLQRAALLGVIDRLRLVPGVEAAGAAEFNTLGRAWTKFVPVPDTAHDEIEATLAPVTEGFFETMRIPLLAGRTFARRDIDAAPATAVVVNQAFATRYFGGQPAVGRVLEGRLGQNDDGSGRHEIVGVAADARYDLRRPAAPTIYFPLRTSGTLHVRVAGDPSALAARLRDEIRAADPLFRVSSIVLQSEVVDRTLVRERLLAALATFFAVVGLVLVAVGLYGVLSYSVVQRTREIGIRLALGARSLGVVRTILSDTAGAVAAGAAGGLAGGWYLSRFVESLLFEVAPGDVIAIVVPLATLVLAAALSALLPALRAARLEPAIALRDQ
ncbi:MAG TPA: ADOP family duplicated permease, partial [Vicinamibacterales bacterium]|nr:ADOP family duplicated permease [Vicinamibacterales bacterium]